MLQKKLALSLVVGALSLSSQAVRATDVFHLEGIGAISRAMGGTAVAHDVGPAGMLTNPATLGLNPGQRQFMVGIDLVTTDITVDNQKTGETARSKSHGKNRGPYLAPELAYTQRIGDVVLGLGAFARGGLGTEYGTNNFLARGADPVGGTARDSGLENSSRLLVLDIPLAASYRVNDALTVGGSIDAMWQGLNLDLFLRTDQVGALVADNRVSGPLANTLLGTLGMGPAAGPGPYPGLQGAHFSLTRNQPLASGIDAWGYGGRLGLLYRLSPTTRLGAAYQFESRMADMKGDATLTAVLGDGTHLPMPGKIKIVDFQMPAKLDLGVSHQLSEQWMVALDISRVFWKDAMKDINVAFVASGGADVNIRLPQNYKDQTIVALGTSYAVSSDWTLRAGVRLATQALRGDTLFAVIPATPRKHLSVGFSYAVNASGKIDFAYSHAMRERLRNGGAPNTGDPVEIKHSQDNATLSYTYSF
jgi:long-chain fatty acid transport protein